MSGIMIYPPLSSGRATKIRCTFKGTMTFKGRAPVARRQIVRNEIIEMISHWHQGGSALRELVTPWALTGIQSASTCGWPKSEEEEGSSAMTYATRSSRR